MGAQTTKMTLCIKILLLTLASPALAHGLFDWGHDLYQIGSEWGKKPVTIDELSRETITFQRAARATAQFTGATAFYLGQFNGHHLMATNHHVLENAKVCDVNHEPSRFPISGKSFPCKKFFGTWAAVDLTLYSIDVSDPADANELQLFAKNFDFNAEFFTGQKLLTIGFGRFRNPQHEMVASQDSDCKVFSGKNEFRQMGDPDQINPGNYAAWSFANGCDVSHGDSGSAMVDRETGSVLGIIWTAATPKNVNVQDTKYLDEMLAKNSPEIWTSIAYGVPAPKIKEELETFLATEKSLDLDTRMTLREFLDR
jgi:hypothetical protein